MLYHCSTYNQFLLLICSNELLSFFYSLFLGFVAENTCWYSDYSSPNACCKGASGKYLNENKGDVGVISSNPFLPGL